MNIYFLLCNRWHNSEGRSQKSRSPKSHTSCNVREMSEMSRVSVKIREMSENCRGKISVRENCQKAFPKIGRTGFLALLT